jgi:hypothetical protein
LTIAQVCKVFCHQNSKAVGRVWAQPTALALSPPLGVVLARYASANPIRL